MTNFDRFKQAFDEKYPSRIQDFIYQKDIPFGGQVEEVQDEAMYDSYGNENSNLHRVYYFADFDIYVKFHGNRASYQGEEWDMYYEVKPVEKIIKFFEAI